MEHPHFAPEPLSLVANCFHPRWLSRSTAVVWYVSAYMSSRRALHCRRVRFTNPQLCASL